jgi:hypothetical protein
MCPISSAPGNEHSRFSSGTTARARTLAVWGFATSPVLSELKPDRATRPSDAERAPRATGGGFLMLTSLLAGRAQGLVGRHGARNRLEEQTSAPGRGGGVELVPWNVRKYEADAKKIRGAALDVPLDQCRRPESGRRISPSATCKPKLLTWECLATRLACRVVGMPLPHQRHRRQPRAGSSGVAAHRRQPLRPPVPYKPNSSRQKA